MKLAMVARALSGGAAVAAGTDAGLESGAVGSATVGFTRRELRQSLGWSEHQVRIGLARLRDHPPLPFFPLARSRISGCCGLPTPTGCLCRSKQTHLISGRPKPFDESH